jgi:hypothetical protein
MFAKGRTTMDFTGFKEIEVVSARPARKGDSFVAKRSDGNF